MGSQSFLSTTAALFILFATARVTQRNLADIDLSAEAQKEQAFAEYQLRLCLGLKATRLNLRDAGVYLAENNPDHSAAIFDEAAAAQNAFVAGFADFTVTDAVSTTSTDLIFSCDKGPPEIPLRGYVYREHTPGRSPNWPNWRFRFKKPS
jgi:hypothetical protein